MTYHPFTRKAIKELCVGDIIGTTEPNQHFYVCIGTDPITITPIPFDGKNPSETHVLVDESLCVWVFDKDSAAIIMRSYAWETLVEKHPILAEVEAKASV